MDGCGELSTMSKIYAMCFSLLVTFSAVGQANDDESKFNVGFSAWTSGDIVGAMEALKSPANAGHAKAQALYGSLLDAADNDTEAAVYYGKAADQNNADGAFGLAGLFLTGDGGERNVAKALALYEKAANLGHTQALAVLASGYISDSFGLGPNSADSTEAWGWIKKASEFDYIDFMVKMEAAYRTGTKHVPKDIKAAEIMRKRILVIQPEEKKKRVRR